MARLLITGASGFLGRAIVKAALDNRQFSHVTASDVMPCELTHEKLTVLSTDLNSSGLINAVANADVVIHLAATLGAAAEADPLTAKQVNLDATINLITHCQRGARFVFASSLAVLGESGNQRAPVMIYGSHKAMAEIAIETATRRGEIDGISLRPGGIVARADQNSTLKSAFLSDVFHAVATGRDITLPVSPDGKTWLASVGNVAENFLHAALTGNPGRVRSLTLPMQQVVFADLVNALQTTFPNSTSQITFAPQDEAMRLFGTAQPLSFTDSLNAGFKADSNLTSLIANALQNGELN